MNKHVSITVHGKVQKTGFRFSAIEKALELNLVGIVQNYGNDQVQIEVEGPVDQLKQFLRWCHTGPQTAQVDKVDYESSEELEHYEDFRAAW